MGTAEADHREVQIELMAGKKDENEEINGSVQKRMRTEGSLPSRLCNSQISLKVFKHYPYLDYVIIVFAAGFK